MNGQDFARWLQGYVEIAGDGNPPDEVQWKIICDHLQLVFQKVTPNYTQYGTINGLGGITLTRSEPSYCATSKISC